MPIMAEPKAASAGGFVDSRIFDFNTSKDLSPTPLVPQPRMSGAQEDSDGYSSEASQSCFDFDAKDVHLVETFSRATSILSSEEGYYSQEVPGQLASNERPAESKDEDSKPLCLNSRVRTPSPLLPEDPESPTFSRRDEYLSADSDDYEESDYQEETNSKARVLYILIQFLLLRECALNSKSTATPLSSSTTCASSESCLDLQNDSYSEVNTVNQSGENSGAGVINGSSGIGSSDVGSPSQKRPQKRKRGDTDDNKDGEEEDNRKEGDKRRKKVDLRSIRERLACPFAKGKPEDYVSCVLVNRQNLSGVKEHLKRNHFDGKLPHNIRASRTWEEVFLICNPEWDPSTPTPSRYFEIDPLMNELLDYIPAGTRLANNQPDLSQGPQTMDSSAQVTVEADSHSYISSHAQSSTQKDESTRTTRSWKFGTMEGPSISSELRNNLFGISGQIDFPEAVKEMLGSWAGSHPSLPITQESRDVLNSAQDYLLNETSVDPHIPPTELYSSFVEGLGISHLDSTRLPSPPVDNQRPSYPDTVLGNHSFDQDTAGFNTTPSFPQSSSDRTLGLTHETSNGSVSTPLITPPSSQPTSQLNGGLYSLMIARRPPIRGSTESHAPKRFVFDNFVKFLNEFEGWMQSNFTDPRFSWETMEISDADSENGLRLASTEDVAMEVEWRCISGRTTHAALCLVMKK
ncbi:hypothetical protein TWF281_011211 [Arthrobotrys megalospora]